MTNAVLDVPWLTRTMHSDGPAGTEALHTVGGAGGRPGAGGPGLLLLLSAAPRMTPPTTRAAPTDVQPTQAMCSRTHCHPLPRPEARAGPAWLGLRLDLGL